MNGPIDGHKRIAHPDKSKMKVCHICGYKAVTNQNLKTHVEAKHENKRNYSCNVCEAKFYNAVQLRNHVKGMLLLNCLFILPCPEALFSRLSQGLKW